MNTAANTSKTCFLFDFDGVLCDSEDKALRIIQELSRVYRYKRVDNLSKLRNLGTQGVIRDLEIAKWKIPFIVMHARKKMKSYAEGLNLFKDIPEMFHSLMNTDLELGVLSSNSTDVVQKVLADNGLAVDFIEAGTSLFGKHKKLKKLKQGRKIYYFGDETRDIDACKRAEIFSVAVSWGYSNIDVLRDTGADQCIHSPKEVLDFYYSIR